jgi:hypothetical protein
MRVIYLDGRESVVRVLPADRLAFERQFKQVWMSEPRFEEHFLWMVWTASRREGLTSAEFDDWVATVEDWFLTDTPEEDSDEPDPSVAVTSSGPGPSTG